MTDPLTRQLDAVVRVLDAVLGVDLLGAYLYGSAVDGGLRLNSDVDLFAVSSRRLSDPHRRRLIDRLRPLSAKALRRPDWRPVELTIVALPDVRPWRYWPRTDFQHGEWLRAQFDAGELEPHEPDTPDLTVQVAQLQQSHVVLRGPAPTEILGEVPWTDVERAMRGSIGGLLEDAESDTTNVLLTLCRIWATLEVGQFMSKDEAADWAAQRVSSEHRPLIVQARAAYLGTAGDEWRDAQTAVAAAMNALVGAIRRP